MGFFSSFLVLLVAVLGGAYAAVRRSMSTQTLPHAGLYAGVGHESQYVFTPEGMKQVADEALAEAGGNATAVIQAVVAKLLARHPACVCRVLSLLVS